MIEQKVEARLKLAMGKRKREVVTQQVRDGTIEGLRAQRPVSVQRPRVKTVKSGRKLMIGKESL